MESERASRENRVDGRRGDRRMASVAKECGSGKGGNENVHEDRTHRCKITRVQRCCDPDLLNKVKQCLSNIP